jgi:hypothetical protein
MTPQTTLVPGAPWPHTINWPMVQDAEPESKRPVAPPPEKRHYRPKAISNETLAKLRNHLAANPGQRITAIRTALGWSQTKTESAMKEIRSEVMNGHVLKASLINFERIT